MAQRVVKCLELWLEDGSESLRFRGHLDMKVARLTAVGLDEDRMG